MRCVVLVMIPGTMVIACFLKSCDDDLVESCLQVFPRCVLSCAVEGTLRRVTAKESLKGDSLPQVVRLKLEAPHSEGLLGGRSRGRSAATLHVLLVGLNRRCRLRPSLSGSRCSTRAVAARQELVVWLRAEYVWCPG